MSKEYNIFKDWKEFDEEQFRLDTDTDEMTINEVISEALATLKTSYEFTEKDFRRVEKTALLGMYYQQNIINKQKEALDKIKEYLEEDDWTSVNGVIAVKLIKEKLNELLEEIE